MKKLLVTTLLGALGLLFSAGVAAAVWAPNPASPQQSRIVNSTTVHLEGPEGQESDTSVEINALGVQVEANAVITFDYQLFGDALCGGGAPRVFVFIDGTQTNSWDGRPDEQCGHGDGDVKTVSFTVTEGGTIEHAGVVKDEGFGYIRVSNLTIGGELIRFRSNPICSVGPGADFDTTFSATIQDAIDDDICQTINVAAGDYAEDLDIWRPVTLNGAQAAIPVDGRTLGTAGVESTIDGLITVNAPDVVITGFSLTNSEETGGLTSVLVKTEGTNAVIGSNIFGDIESDGKVQAIYLEEGPDNVNILYNRIQNIGSTGGSVNGIFAGDSNSGDASTGLLIWGNQFIEINATGGGYGILFNNGAGTTATVLDNTFANISGSWVHAIGLEGPTPDTEVTGNSFEGLDADGSDNSAVFFEANPSFASVQVTDNNFTDTSMLGIAIHPLMTIPSGQTVDGECNYWGAITGPAEVGPGAGANVGPDIDYDPWLTAPAPDAACNGTAEDLDGDGIENSLDTQPGTPSTAFSDGGQTAGEIVSVDAGTSVQLLELPNPEGVRVVVDGPGDVVITLDGKSGSYTFGAGDYVLTDPEQQVTVSTETGGPAVIEYTLADGRAVTIIVEAGESALITQVYEDGELVGVTVEALEGDIEVNGLDVAQGSGADATDVDGDGVANDDDACPSVAAETDHGCVPPAEPDGTTGLSQEDFDAIDATESPTPTPTATATDSSDEASDDESDNEGTGTISSQIKPPNTGSAGLAPAR